jgi:tetratricopeptide (TPR) repeat protein
MKNIIPLLKAVVILSVSIFCLLYYLGVLTQRKPLPLSKEFFSVELSSTADRAIELLAGGTFKGKPLDPATLAASATELDQVFQWKADQGIRNIPILSALLTHLSSQARHQGNSDQAIQLATQAARFSPDLPQPYFELARARWSRDRFRPHQALPDFMRGISAQLKYFPSSLQMFYNGFFIVSNALLMTFILFAIMVLAKYLPLYFYDIQKNLTQQISQLVLHSFRIFFLFIPIILRLDLVWALLFWGVLLWGYVSKRERQLLFFFFIVLIYVPFFIRSFSAFLNGPSSDVILEIHRANYEDPNPEIGQRLGAWLNHQPGDAEALFTLGLLEKRQGRYAEAEKYYQKAIQANPEFSEAYSNLGNLLMARRDYPGAVAAYEKAIGFDPNRAAYHYNLYRAYSQQTFLSGKADAAFRRARQLDPELIDQYSSIDSGRTTLSINRLVIDEMLETPRLWERFFEVYIGREGWLFRFFKAWFERIPSRVAFLVPVLFLGFMIGMSRYGRAKRFLTRCPMCGSPTHRFYLGASDQEFICFNCYRIFVQREKLHPKIVEKKSLQVQSFQKESHFISRFLSAFLVGFGQLWKGYFCGGLFLAFLFFIILLRFIYWEGIVKLPFVPSPPAQGSLVFWGVLFLLIYGLTLWQSYRLRPRFGASLRKS